MKLQRRTHAEGGFSLIEVTVAIGVAAVVIAVMSAGLASGLGAALSAKVLQKATATGNEVLERARALTFDKLAMKTSGLTASGCTNIVSGTYDPDAGGPLAAEPVVSSPTGAVDCVSQRSAEETSFTVRQYLTVATNEPVGASQDLRRLAVIVTWKGDGKTHTYRTSTLIANSIKGTAAGDFELSPRELTTVLVPPARALFGHTISPLAANQNYELTVPDLPAGWTARFFADTNAIRSLDGDLELADTNGNGTPETGTISGPFDLLVEFQPPTGVGPWQYRMTIRATSGTVQRTAVDTVVIN